MAERTPLKVADPIDFSDDDPFAELTRIMGFDPRQPVRPAAPEQVAAPHVEEALDAHDDFDIDLEKELMGDFAADEDDDALAATGDVAAETAPVAEAVAFDEPELDLSDEFELPEEFEHALAASVAAGIEPADLGADDADMAAAGQAEAIAPEPQHAGPAAVAMSDEDALAQEFDAALADVDMDFSADRAVMSPVVEDDFDLDADLDLLDADEDEAVEALAEEPAAEAQDDLMLEAEQALGDLRLVVDGARAEAPPVAAVSDVRDDDFVIALEDVLDLDDHQAADDVAADEDEAATGEQLDLDAAIAEAAYDQPAQDDERAFALSDQDLAAFASLEDEVSPLNAGSHEEAAIGDLDLELDMDDDVEPLSFEDAELGALEAVEDDAPVAFAHVQPIAEATDDSADPAELLMLDDLIAEENLHAVAEGLVAEEAEVSFEDDEVLELAPARVENDPLGAEDDLAIGLAAEELDDEPAGAPREDEHLDLADAAPVAGADGVDFSAIDDLDIELEAELAPQAAEDGDYAIDLEAELASPRAFDTQPALQGVGTDDYRGYDEPLAYDEPLDAAAPVVPAYSSDMQIPEVEDMTRAEPSFSLEDELNALLGNSAPRAAATAARYEASAAPEVDHLVEDLKWELDEGGRAPAVEDIRVPEPAAYAAGEYDSDNEFADILADPDEAHDDLPDFDDDAFDAAIAKGVAPAVAPAAGAALAAARDWRHQPAQPARATPRADGYRQDPLDVINQLTAKYSAPAPVASGRTVSPAAMGWTRLREDVPDIDTIDVPDHAVALADDLDIPEVPFDDDQSQSAAYDDLDAEFAGLLSDLNSAEAAPVRAAPVQARVVDAPAWQQPTHAAYDDRSAPQAYDVDEDFSAASGQTYGQYDYDPDLDNAVALPATAEFQEERRPQRRGLLIAALVGSVALAGAVGAFALSFGGGDSADGPVLVKADDGPVKIKPENPGGTTVPNQDSKVYDTVAGSSPTAAPVQEKLVTATEEPVEVPLPMTDPRGIEPEELPAVGTAETLTPKGEDRIEQILAEADPEAEIVAVAPRKVRTMVVKPDGTLVPREEPVAEAPVVDAPRTVELSPPAAEAPVEELIEPALDAVAAVPETTGATPTFTPPTGGEPVAVAPEASAADTSDVVMPKTVPIAPQRPAQQPVDVVGEVKPDRVSAVAPAPARATAPAPTAAPASAGAAGGWSMQIASQPNEAAAQSTYQDLARRYGSVLGGRQASIVKADIAGKGTFWRVRIPAASRNDAISLCENYKSAGGNCFVSR